MESFVNLMANDVWSDDDIKARLHAEFRTEINELMEREIYRALHALHLRMRPLSAAEQAVVSKFATVDVRVAALGIAARADMALLHNVFAHEAAMSRLAVPGVDESETDLAEREGASAVVASATQAVLDLYLLRNPPPPVQEELGGTTTLGDSNEIGTL